MNKIEDSVKKLAEVYNSKTELMAKRNKIQFCSRDTIKLNVDGVEFYIPEDIKDTIVSLMINRYDSLIKIKKETIKNIVESIKGE